MSTEMEARPCTICGGSAFVSIEVVIAGMICRINDCLSCRAQTGINLADLGQTTLSEWYQ